MRKFISGKPFLLLFYIVIVVIVMAVSNLGNLFSQAEAQGSDQGEKTRFVFSATGSSGSKDHLVVEIWNDELIHFEYSQAPVPPSAEAPLWTSPMVLKKGKDYQGPQHLRIEKSHQGETRLETRFLVIAVNGQSLCLNAYDKRLQKNLHQICPLNLSAYWKGLQVDSPQTTDVYGLGQYFSQPGTADGDWMGRVWDPKEDSHGHKLWPFSGGANSHVLFPIAYALGENKHHYALFVDQVYKQMWTMKGRPWKVEMYGDQVRWFLLAGATFQDLRRNYLELSGKPPVPPKASFGLWVSEFGYENWDEIFGELSDLEKNHFPVDGFALDIQWFGAKFMDRSGPFHDSTFGTLRFDQQNFPQAAETVRHLKRERGVELMTIEESYVSSYLPEHGVLKDKGFLAHHCGSKNPIFLSANPWWGVGGMLDWTNARAGDFWHDQKRQALIQMGITNHWTDLGEPEMYSEEACYSGFPELGKNRHPDIHNVYNLLWLESIARGYQRHQVRERPFMLSRAGTSGLQRLGSGMWSGDIGANFGALTAHLNNQMHMVFSGIDYYGSDVGGFHRRADTLDGNPDKLFTQWLANSALFDFPIRAHTWNLSNNLETSPLKIGDVESNLANIRLRYELMPYYYTAAHQAAIHGDPVIPPLVYWYPEDKTVRKMGNQKMIGRDLMAGVVANYQETHRSVYLPAGEWYHFHTHDVYASQGQEFSGLPVYLKGIFRLPLLARAGAIIPLQVVTPETRNIRGWRKDGRKEKGWKWRIYPASASSSFTSIEDDGHTTDYTQGKKSSTTVHQVLSGDQKLLKIQIEPTQGTYEGILEERDLILEIVLTKFKVEKVVYQDRVISECSAELNSGCWNLSAEGRLMHLEIPGVSLRENHQFQISLASRVKETLPVSATFLCHGGTTQWGVNVFVSGNIPELGSLDPRKAIKLEPHTYPTWMHYRDRLPSGKKIQWRCLKQKENLEMVMEEGPWQEFTTAPGYNGIQESRF